MWWFGSAPNWFAVPAEGFGLRVELYVGFQADGGLIGGAHVSEGNILGFARMRGKVPSNPQGWSFDLFA